MTPRGRLALALGVVAYLIAWAFGSKPLYPVAIGLVLAPLLAWLWVRLAHKPLRLHRSTRAVTHLEGDDVVVDVGLELERRVVPPLLTLVEESAKLGRRETPLARSRGVAWARYVLERLPRGRYSFARADAVVEDPLGLARLTRELPPAGGFVVYPRLVELGRLFSEGAAGAQEGRRLLLRRPAGFDLHSVREYEQGESLRKVHWPTTARRGELMVKELEDSPRDEVAVLLDAERGWAHGESFDAQVRAAGSILRAHAARGKRTLLVVNRARVETVRVSSPDGDWRRALEALAAAEPDGERPAASVLVDEAGPLVGAYELTVVTAALSPALADRLVQRLLRHHRVSLVYVDARTYAGAPPVAVPDALRLQAVGIPVAVVRRASDLRSALAAPEQRAAVG